ncbi:MAG: AzlC family ABC transporter permease [Gammaproteobacteria bacterium]
MSARTAFQNGLSTSGPIVIGYLPIAITFGVVAIQAGLLPLTAVMISALMFSGASQFLLVAMIASGVPFSVALGLCLLLNFRHVFYGPLLARNLSTDTTKLAVLAYGMTDEVFAVALTKLNSYPSAHRMPWLLGLEIGAYAAWVGGTFLGAWLGDWFMHSLPLLAQALQFALPALFLVLLAPYFSGPMGIGICAAVLIAGSFSYLGQATLGILVAAIGGTLLYIGVLRWKPTS